MVKYSPEMKGFIKTGFCPNGHNGYWEGKRLGFEFVEGTGSRVEREELDWRQSLSVSKASRWLTFGMTFLPESGVLREDSRFTCNTCHGTWPIFSDTGQITILGLVNPRRTAASLGFDDYARDNRSSKVPMSAAIEISRRWLQRLEVQWEAAKTTSTAGSFSRYGANIEQKVERSLRTSLAMSEESEQLLKQTINVTVPPRRRLTVRLHWKQIWQEGELRVRLPDGTISEIPYRAAVEMVFDQENIQG